VGCLLVAGSLSGMEMGTDSSHELSADRCMRRGRQGVVVVERREPKCDCRSIVLRIAMLMIGKMGRYEALD
jgi:hypothetical protein